MYIIIENIAFNDIPEVYKVCETKEEAIAEMESYIEDVKNETIENFDSTWHDCSPEEYIEENFEYNEDQMLFTWEDEEGTNCLVIQECSIS